MTFYSQWKFTFLLVVMLLLNLTRLCTVEDFDDRFILDLLGAGVLTAATVSLCIEKRSRSIAILLGMPATILSLVRNLFTENVEYIVQFAARMSSLLFLIFLIAIILRTLMTQSEVTHDSIAGAFCGYIMIGLIFAEAYCMLETAVPNSFQINLESTKTFGDHFQRWMLLEYFSFTTLTTLGIGDILPATPAARGLTLWEVICGQFYLAVLVASLVNLRGSRDPT